MKNLAFTIFLFAVSASAQLSLYPVVASSTSTATAATPTVTPITSGSGASYTYTGGSTSVTLITGATPPSGQSIYYCVVSSGSCSPSTLYSGTLSFSSTENIFFYSSAPGYNNSLTVEWVGTYIAVPSILQSNFNATACTTTACTTTLVNHAAGGMTCVGSTGTQASGGNLGPTAISNTAGFTWTTVTGGFSPFNGTYLWWSCAPTTAYTGTDTFTVTRATGTTSGGIVVYDIGNVSAVNAQATGSCTSGCTGAAPTVSFSVTGPYDMLLGLGGYLSTSSFSQGSGFTCTTCAATDAPWNSSGSSSALAEYRQISGSSAVVNLGQTHSEWGLFGLALQ